MHDRHHYNILPRHQIQSSATEVVQYLRSFTPKHNTLSQGNEFVFNDAKDFFELSNSQDKPFTRKQDFEIQKRSVLEEVEKPEPDPKEEHDGYSVE